MDGNSKDAFSAWSPLLLLMWAAAFGPVHSAARPQPGAHPSAPPAADSLARRIAVRYGADAFPGVRALHYKFNVRMGDKRIAREWTWFPGADSVAYLGPDEKGLPISANYSRKNPYSMASPGVAAIDKSFVNDQYWLLFPLHLRWDQGISLTVARAEASDAAAYRLTVAYPSSGGYTPGDAYDLYVDTAGTLKRWMFRKGNTGEPGREASWSEPVEIGGLHFSLEHAGPGKDFRLWFTDVKVDR